MRRKSIYSGILILFVLALCSLFLIKPHRKTDAKGAGDPSTKLYTPPPQPSPPPQSYEIYAGLWRTDGSFDSTLRIRNELLVAPLDVTPVLFMADGTEYAMPPIHVATGGVAAVDINQALASASDAIAPHLSQFGSAELKWQYTSAGHVQASVQMLNIPQSLIFVAPFNGVDDTASGPQTVEGLWWRHDPDTGGYVSLANVTGNSVTATVQVIGSGGTTLPAGTFTLAAHATQMLDLDELAGGLPGLENQAGGIRVQYKGPMDGLMVTGGMVNAEEGYSATLPFGLVDATDSKPSAITYASAGLMAGAADSMMGFPGGTLFEPYLVLRNTTANSLTVSPTLNWMQGGGPVTQNLPALTIGPLQTVRYDMKSSMAKLGLKNFSVSVNLSASFKGHGGDLLIATGSVDNTGTYVFEVEPQSVSQSDSKQVSYWTTANGFDTMYSLWNPTSEAEDLTMTFYYGDGSGSYVLPVHLSVNGSTMIDVMMLVESQQPDPQGHVFPMTETAGSAIIRNTAEGTTKTIDGTTLPAPFTLVVAGGVFSVQTATCGTTCVSCCGYSGFTVVPGSFFCPVGESMQCSCQATNCNGVVQTAAVSTWSSNNTAVATIDSSGLMAGASPGSVTLTASLAPITVYTGQVCTSAGGQPTCPQGTPQPTASGSVTPTIRLGGCSGTDITGKTESAVTGQQVSLCGSYGTLPSGVTVTSQSWSVGGTTAGGFNHGTTGGYSAPTLNQQSTTIYWLAAGNSLQTKFTLNLSNGTSSSATASFNVAGPTSVSLSPNPPAMGNWQISSGPDLQLGCQLSGCTNGIKFNGSATSPSGDSGTYEWVQIITTFSGTATSGSTTYNCSTTIGLDTGFPYGHTGLEADDSPDIGLDSSSFSKQTFSFGATMYLMWDPTLTNSIAVPLGHVTWQAYGDAAFSNSNWTIQSDSSRSAGSFQAGSSGPSWTSVFKASDGLTCQ